MKCLNCKKKFSNDYQFCPYCGTEVKETKTSTKLLGDNKPNILLNIASIINPFVGLILYLTLNKKEPDKANSALKFAVFGVLIFLAGEFVALFYKIMQQIWR